MSEYTKHFTRALALLSDLSEGTTERTNTRIDPDQLLLWEYAPIRTKRAHDRLTLTAHSLESVEVIRYTLPKETWYVPCGEYHQLIAARRLGYSRVPVTIVCGYVLRPAIFFLGKIGLWRRLADPMTAVLVAAADDIQEEAPILIELGVEDIRLYSDTGSGRCNTYPLTGVEVHSRVNGAGLENNELLSTLKEMRKRGAANYPVPCYPITTALLDRIIDQTEAAPSKEEWRLIVTALTNELNSADPESLIHVELGALLAKVRAM